MQAYCIDDTGIAKKGDRSVGVHRQYSGTLGKIGNCQVVVSLRGVSDSFGACLGLQLYLPESWCKDADRRKQAKVPDDITFQKKWPIALGLLESARSTLKSIVRLAKMRWHIERDYQDMKQQLGFDKYEGRSWGGLHRHLAMVALLHTFIALHMEDFSPPGFDEEMDLE